MKKLLYAILIGLIAVVLIIAVAVHLYSFRTDSAAIGIIGGADGPTSIFITD